MCSCTCGNSLPLAGSIIDKKLTAVPVAILYVNALFNFCVSTKLGCSITLFHPNPVVGLLNVNS